MNRPAGTGSGAVAFPKNLKIKSLWPGLAAALLALACIPFSVAIYFPVFHFLRRLPLKGFFAAAVQFPSGFTFSLILAAIALLQPVRRTAIIFFLVALGVSSLANESLKHMTGRARPYYSVLLRHDEKQWILNYRSTHPGTRMLARNEDQWLGLKADHPLMKDGFSSFPSGHANSSFVMAAFLTVLYPEGRLLWYLAAGGASLARIDEARHWPEDVLFGGALGWTIAQWVFSWRWPVRLGLFCSEWLGRLARLRGGSRGRRKLKTT